MVRVRDGIQQLDPQQHKFKEEFAHCQDNEAYYITNKGQRKTAGGGELETSVIIETTSGYWREKKKDLPVYNGDDLIGHKTSYVFCSRENDETSWTMDALAVNPEIIPVAAKNQTSEESSNEYEDFEEEEEDLEMEELEEEAEEQMGEVSSPASKPLANVRDANQGVSTFGAVLDMVTDRPGFIFMSLLALDIASHWLQMYSTFLVGKASHKDVKDSTSWLFRVYYRDTMFMGYCCVACEVPYITLFLLANSQTENMTVVLVGFA
ncbi:hypothetical protein AgCh_019971 [Apium graveolens]